MNVTLTYEFSSRGDFMPGGKRAAKMFERTVWQNQHAHGWLFEVNFIWFCATLEFYFPAGKKEEPYDLPHGGVIGPPGGTQRPPPGTDPYGFDTIVPEIERQMELPLNGNGVAKEKK